MLSKLVTDLDQLVTSLLYNLCFGRLFNFRKCIRIIGPNTRNNSFFDPLNNE